MLARGGHARDVAGEAERGHVARTAEAEWWLQRPQLLQRRRVVRERRLGKATLVVVREVPLVGAAPGTRPTAPQGLGLRCLRERALHGRMGGLVAVAVHSMAALSGVVGVRSGVGSVDRFSQRREGSTD